MLRALVLSLLCFAAAPVLLAVQERSFSASRQFVVYGEDVRLRGAICGLAEDTKAHLLTLLGEHDNWKTPIVVNAQLPQANLPELPPAALQVTDSPAGMKLQLDLVIGNDVAAPQVQRQLLRAILLELMYRGAPLKAGAHYIEPPAWLLDGVLALQPGVDRAALAQKLRSPFPAAAQLAQFLTQGEELLDHQSRELYRAGSLALVQMLLHTSDGRKYLGRFIRDLPTGALDPVADLRAHFPELNKTDIDQAWHGAIERLIASNAVEPLSVPATREQLDALLVGQVLPTKSGAEAKRTSIDNFFALLREPGGRVAFAHTAEALLLFQPRANPVYREIVVEYHEIAALLARGSVRHVPERLARVKQWREQLASRMNRIDDYLNWFEATQSTTRSGLFDEYLRSSADAAEHAPRRRDRISVYLNALESQTAD